MKQCALLQRLRTYTIDLKQEQQQRFVENHKRKQDFLRTGSEACNKRQQLRNLQQLRFPPFSACDPACWLPRQNPHQQQMTLRVVRAADPRQALTRPGCTGTARQGQEQLSTQPLHAATASAEEQITRNSKVGLLGLVGAARLPSEPTWAAWYATAQDALRAAPFENQSPAHMSISKIRKLKCLRSVNGPPCMELSVSVCP